MLYLDMFDHWIKMYVETRDPKYLDKIKKKIAAKERLNKLLGR